VAQGAEPFDDSIVGQVLSVCIDDGYHETALLEERSDGQQADGRIRRVAVCLAIAKFRSNSAIRLILMDMLLMPMCIPCLGRITRQFLEQGRASEQIPTFGPDLTSKRGLLPISLPINSAISLIDRASARRH